MMEPGEYLVTLSCDDSITVYRSTITSFPDRIQPCHIQHLSPCSVHKVGLLTLPTPLPLIKPITHHDTPALRQAALVQLAFFHTFQPAIICGQAMRLGVLPGTPGGDQAPQHRLQD